MKNYLKIQMYDGKGGYENVLIEKDFKTGLTKTWLNCGYTLYDGTADLIKESLGTEVGIMTLTVKKADGKKILKDLFVEYKNLEMGENNV